MSHLQRVSDKSLGADFYAVFAKNVLTIVVRSSSGIVSSYWTATRLLESGGISQTFQLELPHEIGPNNKPAEAEQIVFSECSDVFESFVRPLLELQSNHQGRIPAFVAPDHFIRVRLALTHMKLHESIQNLGDVSENLNLRTTRLYQIAKAFGIGTAVQVIADFEGVGSTTITRRLGRARDAKLLEKQLKTTLPRGKGSGANNVG
jgi:hypothetical protein